jgi:hypothetical protein
MPNWLKYATATLNDTKEIVILVDELVQNVSLPYTPINYNRSQTFACDNISRSQSHNFQSGFDIAKNSPLVLTAIDSSQQESVIDEDELFIKKIIECCKYMDDLSKSENPIGFDVRSSSETSINGSQKVKLFVEQTNNRPLEEQSPKLNEECESSNSLENKKLPANENSLPHYHLRNNRRLANIQSSTPNTVSVAKNRTTTIIETSKKRKLSENSASSEQTDDKENTTEKRLQSLRKKSRKRAIECVEVLNNCPVNKAKMTDRTNQTVSSEARSAKSVLEENVQSTLNNIESSNNNYVSPKTPSDQAIKVNSTPAAPVVPINTDTTSFTSPSFSSLTLSTSSIDPSLSSSTITNSLNLSHSEQNSDYIDMLINKIIDVSSQTLNESKKAIILASARELAEIRKFQQGSINNIQKVQNIVLNETKTVADKESQIESEVIVFLSQQKYSHATENIMKKAEVPMIPLIMTCEEDLNYDVNNIHRRPFLSARSENYQIDNFRVHNIGNTESISLNEMNKGINNDYERFLRERNNIKNSNDLNLTFLNSQTNPIDFSFDINNNNIFQLPNLNKEPTLIVDELGLTVCRTAETAIKEPCTINNLRVKFADKDDEIESSQDENESIDSSSQTNIQKIPHNNKSSVHSLFYENIDLIEIDSENNEPPLNPITYGLKVATYLFTSDELKNGVIIDPIYKNRKRIREPLDENKINILRGKISIRYFI